MAAVNEGLEIISRNDDLDAIYPVYDAMLAINDGDALTGLSRYSATQNATNTAQTGIRNSIRVM